MKNSIFHGAGREWLVTLWRGDSGGVCVCVCMSVSREGGGGVFLKWEAGIFSNYSPSSPSHLTGQGGQSQARLLVLGACPPSHADLPPLSPLQQL